MWELYQDDRKDWSKDSLPQQGHLVLTDYKSNQLHLLYLGWGWQILHSQGTPFSRSVTQFSSAFAGLVFRGGFFWPKNRAIYFVTKQYSESFVSVFPWLLVSVSAHHYLDEETIYFCKTVFSVDVTLIIKGEKKYEWQK